LILLRRARDYRAQYPYRYADRGYQVLADSTIDAFKLLDEMPAGAISL
jgi:hypothetical protein